MNQLFLLLVQSVTGNVITIVALGLAAAITGFIIAWLYAKSVYKPVIKNLEEEKAKLNNEISRLKNDVSGLGVKAEGIEKKIISLENDLENRNNEINELSAKAVSLGKYAVSQAKSGEYYFNLRATNGQVILTSPMFASKEDCGKIIESVRELSNDDARYDRKLSSNNKPFFNLISHSGQIIGKSEIYESDANMEKGIASVKRNGPTTSIIEE